MHSKGHTPAPRWFFTEPWDPVSLRRGDALGLRAITDHFGDLLAPDLTNRTRDLRWVTILAWCLCRSQAIWRASKKPPPVTRYLRDQRYAWIRPLELMWVARTMLLAAETYAARQLPGQRKLRHWLDDYDRKRRHFAMTDDQYRRYRQTGAYGAYRVAFRKWPGLTRGDGFTPAKEAYKLAAWLESKLGAHRPAFAYDKGRTDDADGLSGKWNMWKGREEEWWLSKWASFDQGGAIAAANTLPRERSDFSAIAEAQILRPILFGDDVAGSRRKHTVAAAAKTAGHTHAELCAEIAARLARGAGMADLGALSDFTRLADAAMDTMDAIARASSSDEETSVEAVTRSLTVRSACGDLVAAAKQWKLNSVPVLHRSTVDALADHVLKPSVTDCLIGLLHHHESSGGGLRWFLLRDGKLLPRSSGSQTSARYRFRLFPLSRMAVQCGEAETIPVALADDEPGLLPEELSEEDDDV